MCVCVCVREGERERVWWLQSQKFLRTWKAETEGSHCAIILVVGFKPKGDNALEKQISLQMLIAKQYRTPHH